MSYTITRRGNDITIDQNGTTVVINSLPGSVDWNIVSTDKRVTITVDGTTLEVIWCYPQFNSIGPFMINTHTERYITGDGITITPTTIKVHGCQFYPGSI